MSTNNYHHILSNIEAQKNLLRISKPQKIEGVCAEINFFDKLLRPSFNHFSTGWWFYPAPVGYTVVKLCTKGINTLSELDHIILKHFHSQHINSYVVEFSYQEAAFFWRQFTGEDLNTFKQEWSTNKTLHLPHKTIPERSSTGPKKEAAITYLEKCGQLLTTAIERIFVDYHLPNCLWDLDCITIHNGALIGFEMKQKYPIRNGTFGLNTGLINLFNFLNAKGIRIIHTILTKPVWNEDFSAIELYTEEPYRSHCLWLAAEYSSNKLINITHSAPAKTSFSGNYSLDYQPISVSHFSKIGSFNNLPEKPLIELLTGNCTRLTNVNDIPELRLANS